MTATPPFAVAMIPARGGSRGVPRKNIRPLWGYPLIAWAIAAARMCETVGRTIVTTDDPEIAETARRFGAEVPFLRPAELASDTATDLDVVRHFLGWLGAHEGFTPELVVHLRPTTPLRDPEVVDRAVLRLRADPAATALRSVHALAESPHKMFRIVDGRLDGFFPDDPRPEYYNLPRQAFPVAYQPNGYVDVLRPAFIREGGSLHGTAMLPQVTPVAAEVDRPEDFELLEYQLHRGAGAKLLARLKAEFPPETGGTGKPFDLVVYDFDGVMTDDRALVFADGIEAVRVSRSDGWAVARIRDLGIAQLILSTETNPVVAARAKKLGIDVLQGVADKAAALSAWAAERGLDPARAAFVGNDVNDLGAMALVGFRAAPLDSHPAVLAAADRVLPARGGDHAVRAFYEACILSPGRAG